MKTEIRSAALILIDIQNDYFEAGTMPLTGADQPKKMPVWFSIGSDQRRCQSFISNTLRPDQRQHFPSRHLWIQNQ